MNIVLLLVFNVFLFTISQANANDSWLIDNIEVAFFEDKTAQLSFHQLPSPENQADWQTYDYLAQDLNFAQTDSLVWLRVHIACQIQQEQALYFIEIANPNLKRIGFYDQTGQRLNQTGANYSPETKPFFALNFVYPVTAPSCAQTDSQTYFFQIETAGRMLVPLRINSAEQFQRKHITSQIFYAIYYGILVTVAIYFLIFSIILRQPSFFYYSLFTATALVAFMSDNGLLRLYIWPNAVAWNEISALFSYTLAVVLGLQVTRSFLSTAKFYPLLDRVILIMGGYYLILIVLFIVSLFSSWSGTILFPFVWLSAPLAGLIIVLVAFKAYLNKQKSAGLYLLAWLSLWGGVCLVILVVYDRIPASFWTEHILMLSSLVELMFLSLAMADKIYLTRKEKEDALQLALKSDQQRLQLLSESEMKLKKAVEEKTYDIQQTLSNEVERHNQFKKLTDLVSHEFRNPLYLMLARLELLEKLTNNHKTIQITRLNPHLTVIKQAGEKLKQLLYEWDEQGKLKELFLVPKKKPVELAPFVKKLCDDAQMLYPEHQIEYQYQQGAVYSNFELDKDLFKIALFNLIDNACKYSAKGSLVSVAVQPSPTQAQIAVCDQGSGIAPEEMPHLFEDYFRSPRHKNTIQGLGLGLALVKQIIQGHDGEVKLESKLNKGSCFYLILPTHKEKR
ncbi:sensor histidine kinase [Thiomicrospira microaerophila]|uniref:sensor histidine kinase n=1 Tax=Thiomicrospira microaerophila TaxID=406020 RepID=UPI0005C8757A|nr:sensor histidine kinase [Thiomicrospira microaerophila]